MAFKLIHTEETVRVAHDGPLVLTVYSGPPTLSALNELEKLLARLTKMHGLTVSLTVIGQAKFLRVDEPVREKGLQMAKRFEATERGLGLVVAATGLSATVARTFLSGFFLLRKSPTPTQVFSTVADGLAYVKAKVPEVVLVQAVSLESVEAVTSEA